MCWEGGVSRCCVCACVWLLSTIHSSLSSLQEESTDSDSCAEACNGSSNCEGITAATFCVFVMDINSMFLFCNCHALVHHIYATYCKYAQKGSKRFVAVVSAELEQRQQVIQIEMRSQSGDTSAASSVGSKSPGPCYSDSDSDSDDDDVVQGSGVIVSNGRNLNLLSVQNRQQQLQVEAAQLGSGSLDRTLSALDLKAAAFD